MGNRLNTRNLLIIFVVLLIGVLGVEYWQSGQGESNFQADLVPVDSGAVDKMLILPQFDQQERIELIKQNGAWNIHKNGKLLPAKQQRVDRALSDLYNNFEADKLLATGQDQWQEYGVDSSGTLLKLFVDDKLRKSFVLGEMTFKKQRVAYNYIREQGEDRVFAIQAYLGASFKGSADDWINKQIFPGNKASWQSIKFDNPNGASFSLEKQKNQWMMDGAPADQQKVDDFLTTLEDIKNKGKVGMDENLKPSTDSTFTMNITGQDKSASLKFRYAEGQRWMVNSSLNQDNFFIIQPSFIQQLRKSRDYFRKEG